MKKAFMSIAIAVAAIAMVSCGNKGAEGAGAGTDKAEPEGKQLTLAVHTYEGDTLMLSCDVWYPEDASMKEIEEYDTFNGRKTLADSTENVKMTLYLQESKVGEYDAYAYASNKDYNVTILFENISETTDRYLDIQLKQLMMKSDGPGGKEFFEQNEKVKSIVNSLRYNGIVKKTMELQ